MGTQQQGQRLVESFGIALRSLRVASGLSQERLAEAAGIHRTYLSQVERGLKCPSLSTIGALASALDVSPSALVRQAEEAAQAVRISGGPTSVRDEDGSVR